MGQLRFFYRSIPHFLGLLSFCMSTLSGELCHSFKKIRDFSIFPLLQILWLAMTTNERMNCRRYKYMKFDSNYDAISPFDRGIIQNLVEFCGWNCFPKYQSKKTDWKSLYDVDNLDGITTL